MKSKTLLYPSSPGGINDTSIWWNSFFLKSSKLFVWVTSFLFLPNRRETFRCFADTWGDWDLLRLGWFHLGWRQGLNPNFLTSLFLEKKTHLSCYFPRLVIYLSFLSKEGNSSSSAELIFGALFPLLFMRYLICACHIALALEQGQNRQNLPLLWYLSSGGAGRQ